MYVHSKILSYLNLNVIISSFIIYVFAIFVPRSPFALLCGRLTAHSKWAKSGMRFLITSIIKSELMRD
jgi:hypothetical protein